MSTMKKGKWKPMSTIMRLKVICPSPTKQGAPDQPVLQTGTLTSVGDAKEIS